MSWLAENAWKGKRSFAAHTGMTDFPAGTRWRASDAEEGVLLGENGSIATVMPGCTIRLGRAGVADLVVFNRSGRISGLVGSGEIVGPDGTMWGGSGAFVCSVLQPRRFAPEAAPVLESEAALKELISSLIRPGFRRGAEKALAEWENGSAQMQRAAAVHIANEMREILIPHGLMLEQFDMNTFREREDVHV